MTKTMLHNFRGFILIEFIVALFLIICSWQAGWNWALAPLGFYAGIEFSLLVIPFLWMGK